MIPFNKGKLEYLSVSVAFRVITGSLKDSLRSFANSRWSLLFKSRSSSITHQFPLSWALLGAVSHVNRAAFSSWFTVLRHAVLCLPTCFPILASRHVPATSPFSLSGRDGALVPAGIWSWRLSHGCSGSHLNMTVFADLFMKLWYMFSWFSCRVPMAMFYYCREIERLIRLKSSKPG